MEAGALLLATWGSVETGVMTGLLGVLSAPGALWIMRRATAAVREKAGIRQDMMFDNLTEKMKDARIG